MNKNTGDPSESSTLFEPPDFSHLVERSVELRNRTRAVYEDMRLTSIRLHETLKHSAELLEEAASLRKRGDRSDV